MARYHDSWLCWQVTYAISETVFLEEEEKCLLIAQWTKSRKIGSWQHHSWFKMKNLGLNILTLKSFQSARTHETVLTVQKKQHKMLNPMGNNISLRNPRDSEFHILRIAKFCCIVIWLSHHHKSSDYWRRAKNFKGGPQLKKPNPNLMFKR